MCRASTSQSLYYCLFAPHICGVVLHAHSVRGESQIQRNANGEFATVSVWNVVCGRFINFWKGRNFWLYWLLVALVMSMVMQYCFVLLHSLVGTQLMIGQSLWVGALDSIVKSIDKLWVLHIFSINTRSSPGRCQFKVKITEKFERRRQIWFICSSASQTMCRDSKCVAKCNIGVAKQTGLTNQV